MLSDFIPVSPGEVARLLSRMAGVSSRLDVIPTQMIIDLTYTLFPMIAHLANLSFETGIFPAKFMLHFKGGVLSELRGPYVCRRCGLDEM